MFPRAPLLLLLFSLTLSASLKPHLWKHRLILLFSDEEASLLMTHQEGILDREIIYYHFKMGEVLTNDAEGLLNEKSLERVKEQYQEKGKVILIGKDGGIKHTAQELDLEKIFSLIDAMPMRRAEIRQKKDKE